MEEKTHKLTVVATAEVPQSRLLEENVISQVVGLTQLKFDSIVITIDKIYSKGSSIAGRITGDGRKEYDVR